MQVLHINHLVAFVVSREHGGVDFNTINLNSSACWFDECPSVEVVNIHQLEKNTIFVATECIR